MSVSNQLAILDQALALERVGGDEELLQEMAQLFLEECPAQLDAVREAVQSRDAKALERSAHSLKGSVGNFGAALAHHAALTLEMAARKGELESVDAALAHLEDALGALQPRLEALASARG